MLYALEEQCQQKDPIISIQAPGKAVLKPFVSQHEITLLSSAKFLLEVPHAVVRVSGCAQRSVLCIHPG